MTRKTISVKHLDNISELNNEVNWSDFSINTPNGNILSKENFSLVAIGNPNIEKEKWDMNVLDERYNTQQDLIYFLVIENKILKIGKSITTMAKRVKSYHCGKDSYRRKKHATNSATNWFILQSVLSINKPVYIYVLFVPQTSGEFMGWTYQNRISKEIEGKIISTFQAKYGKKPIGNKQN